MPGSGPPGANLSPAELLWGGAGVGRVRNENTEHKVTLDSVKSSNSPTRVTGGGEFLHLQVGET